MSIETSRRLSRTRREYQVVTVCIPSHRAQSMSSCTSPHIVHMGNISIHLPHHHHHRQVHTHPSHARLHLSHNDANPSKILQPTRSSLPKVLLGAQRNNYFHFYFYLFIFFFSSFSLSRLFLSFFFSSFPSVDNTFLLSLLYFLFLSFPSFHSQTDNLSLCLLLHKPNSTSPCFLSQICSKTLCFSS
ncbi:Uncharacterized protein TCM_012458 [Theobroma cacao]|uniref:Uncharacterized protein n=1 Tax=Theobroma cacao TaxID=3641 RepID=A0A061FV38_THECC|nr:Uncharacterized protein TCM_012458 [Theobroma cacao]